MELAKEVYRITRIFPKEEMHGLTSQMRRASVSVPANIAEGWARTRKEYMRFLLIARGSLMELETYLLLCNDLDYLKEEASKDFLEKCSQIGKMLFSTSVIRRTALGDIFSLKSMYEMILRSSL